MPFAGYADWKDTLAYSRGSVVYHKTYLYVAMTDCDAGDDPLSSTFTEYFNCGDFGFDMIYPTEEEPNPDNTYSQTMRKWSIYDLPCNYYYQRLAGRKTQPGEFESFETGEVMVLNVYRPLGPDDGAGEAKLKYNWRGYGLTFGLNSEWPDPEEGELVYHISFVPLDPAGPESIMPYQYGDETVSGLSFESHLYQYNTSTFFAGDYYGAGTGPFNPGTVRMSCMYLAAFSRTHNFTGDPSGSATLTSPAFADNYFASIPELPVTDPPTYWLLTGINPNHPD